MKKSVRLILTILALLSISSVCAQPWTTTGTNVVNLTTPTNNVVIGPTPTTPTQLHLNGLANPNLVFTLENTAAAYPNGIYTGIQFKGAGLPFEMYTNQFPACGAGQFHISPVTAGPGIHFTGGRIIFASTPSTLTWQLPGICGNSSSQGTYSFNSSVGASSLNIGYTDQLTAPGGYLLTNLGKSYFKDKVLIGTSSTAVPTSAYKLYVGGAIVCEELVVKLQTNWGDYVFAPDYKLKSLSEVKTYITENSHLPDVPAACEIAENGVATGEMLTIQMKKIEELTLYLIQMEERIKELEAQNKVLQK